MEVCRGTAQIWTVPLEEQGGQLKAGKPEQFLKSSFNDGVPVVLARRAMAGVSYRTNRGKYEVYVRAFPPPSPDLDKVTESGRSRTAAAFTALVAERTRV